MKKILLIVTGSIAAPKALILHNLLKDQFQVNVIATPNAKHFVKFPAKIKVEEELFVQEFYKLSDEIIHVNYGWTYDLIIVYPATMNFISKIALGICDNLALATFFASKAPKIIFPAMNINMYENTALQRNLALLKHEKNITIIDPEVGNLAEKINGQRMIGIGRLPEAETAHKIVMKHFKEANKLTGKTILINFGATRAKLDEVRFLTSASSGKMGIAIVNTCLAMGAKVVAIVGDIKVSLPVHINLTIHSALDNQTMLTKMQDNFVNAKVVFCLASLNDYYFANQINGKISKIHQNEINTKLIKNIDILEELGKQKNHQVLIGFSAQDNNDLSIAKQKMLTKKCDAIVFNHINVFEQNQTDIKVLTKNNIYNFSGDKLDVAYNLVTLIEQIFN